MINDKWKPDATWWSLLYYVMCNWDKKLKRAKNPCKYKIMYKHRGINEDWKTFKMWTLSSEDICKGKLIDLKLKFPQYLFCAIMD